MNMNFPAFLLSFFLICLDASVICSAMELGPPPEFPPFEENFSRDYEPHIFSRGQALSVNPQNKGQSWSFYHNTYLASEQTAMEWTGDHASCAAGATSQAFRDAVRLRINYFRAMAGVPAGVTFSSIYTDKAQQAALMMSVNDSLNHHPPDAWTCYTSDGDEAAGKSNLYLGNYSWHAITGYVKDPGVFNGPVGHRRWILYPQTQVMGSGDIPWDGGYRSSNALWVFDDNIWGPRPDTREDYVAWPPPGWAPYMLVFPRWSFSYSGADFSETEVFMTREGMDFPLTMETLANGYGENTIVWLPTGLGSYSQWPVENNVTYGVSLKNVRIGGSLQDFFYEVHVFDPNDYALVYASVAPGAPCAGKEPCYASIQDAVDSVDPGTDILVAEGEYWENVRIDGAVRVVVGWDENFVTQSPATPVILSGNLL